MRWVVRKRMRAAAASSSPLPSRTPACWRASPSCSSSPPTLDRYSWASTGLLWTSSDQCEMKLSCQLVRAGLNSPQEENLFLFIVLPCQFSGPWSSGSLAAVRQVRTLLYQKYLSSRSRAVPRCSRSLTEGVAAFFFMFYQPFPDSCSL